jgi:hypothetical protein
MSAPQPSVVVVDAAASTPRPASIGVVIVRWLGWGVLAGVALGVVAAAIGLAWANLPLPFYFAVPMMFVGVTVCGTVGGIAGWIAAGSRSGPRADDRPTGYGPATGIRRSAPRPVRALLVVWVLALAVGWAGCIVCVTVLAGGRLDPAIGVAVAGAFVGVALVVTGVSAIPYVRVAAITAIVIGPVLALGGFGVAIGASMWLARNPPLTNSGEPELPQGEPPYESSEWEAPAEGSRYRMPGPPALISDGTVSAADVGPLLDDAARSSLLIAPVAADDVSPDELFPAALTPCPWATAEGMVQATTDIWFDSDHDPVAIQQLREYWVSLGYTVELNEPDLVVVHGTAGLVGAQFSVERTWDDELRLRMQSVCVPG